MATPGKLFDKNPFSAGSNLAASGSVVPLPGEPGRPVDIVTVMPSSTSSRYRVARFNAGSTDSVWKSGEFAGNSTAIPMVVGNETAFVVSGSTLLAFRLSDGTKMWEHTLSDELATSCETCLLIIGDHVATKTNDGELTSFNVADGTPSWTRRLETTNAQVFTAHTSIGVIDGAGIDDTVALIDPVSGAVTDEFTPKCANADGYVAGGISSGAQVLTTPGDPGIYVGFGIMPACWQRLDPTTDSFTWNVILEDGYLDNGSVGFIGGGTLWFTTRDRAVLGGINLASGHFTALPKLQDTDSIPIALHGNTLILRGVSTRGTPRYMLWGLDVPSGAQPWQFLLDSPEPADPPGANTMFVSEGSQRFTAHIEGDRLYIVVFDGTTRTIVVNTVNPDTGATSPPAVLANTTGDLLPDFLPITWRGKNLVLRLGDAIVQVDVESGAITHRWS